MKLFQIEEPDGALYDGDAPGAAVGIDVAADRVAIAVGGNAELLPAEDDESAGREAVATLLALRRRAERQLARPVTHAAIVADGKDAAALEAAALAAGLSLLRLVPRAEAAALAKGAAAADAPALGAAIIAEDLAPPAEG
jgi:hypothetical protein